ncbi:TPA: hypothetical protein DCZ39_01255 [Patescibacteria group bacterium]|nr:hypothetical protein [Candidatus Gracilibacteria bacterium]
MTSIVPNTFVGYTNLQYLNLDHNSITSIESGSFN